MDSFKKLTIPYPSSILEQKKIADCFVSIDKEIDVTKHKLEQLKEHKKGLMQRLFPAKGKTTPELRFPEFQNDGEWIPRPLSDILNYEQPVPYIVEDDTYKKEGIPVLTANKGFILGYTDESFGIYNKLPVIIFDDFTTDKKYVDFPFKIKSSAIKLLTLKYEKRDNLRFIFECMNNIVFNEKEHKRYYISTYQHITILVPNSLQEQEKIAETLTKVDKLIAEYDKKIKALELHKKGLMQQLFPKL
jgi:type I restriction enzyme S subunit